MEKAILKTLVYADIFDYPLTLREIHKWLIGKKAEPRQIKLDHKKYYSLPGREKIIRKRLQRQKQSKIYFRKIKIIAQLLKIIPWIKLVGISGGLAMDNAGKKDDIDLFVITSKNRLWISRLLALFILQLTGQRRKATYSIKQAAGKICLNILLEEDKLEQKKKNLYTAHEVLQMKVLWQRDGIYSKYLADNEWAFRCLPNWVGERIRNQELRIKHKNLNSLFLPLNSILSMIEGIAKKFQLWYMKPPKGLERIEEGAVYFHPTDRGKEIMEKYKLKIAALDK